MSEERNPSQRLFDSIDHLADGAGKTVVVLVRDPAIRAVVIEQLDGLNCQHLTVDDRFGVLDELRRMSADVVLSDFDAWEEQENILFERIDSLEKQPRVVFLGARREARRAARAGAVDYVPLPVDPKEVVDVVSRTLRGEGRFIGAAGQALEALTRIEPPPLPQVDVDIDYSLVDAALSDEEIAALEEPIEASTALDEELLGASADSTVGGLTTEGEPGAATSDVTISPDELPVMASWWRFFFDVRRELRGEADPETRLTRLIDCFRDRVVPSAVGAVEFSGSGPRIQSGSHTPAAADAMAEAEGRAWAAIIVTCLTGYRDPRVIRFPLTGNPPGRERYFVAYFTDNQEMPSGEILDELSVLIAEAFPA